MITKPQKTGLYVHVSVKTKEELTALAVNQETSMSALIRQAIKQYLKNND